MCILQIIGHQHHSCPSKAEMYLIQTYWPCICCVWRIFMHSSPKSGLFLVPFPKWCEKQTKQTNKQNKITLLLWKEGKKRKLGKPRNNKDGLWNQKDLNLNPGSTNNYQFNHGQITKWLRNIVSFLLKIKLILNFYISSELFYISS